MWGWLERTMRIQPSPVRRSWFQTPEKSQLPGRTQLYPQADWKDTPPEDVEQLHNRRDPIFFTLALVPLHPVPGLFQAAIGAGIKSSASVLTITKTSKKLGIVWRDRIQSINQSIKQKYKNAAAVQLLNTRLGKLPQLYIVVQHFCSTTLDHLPHVPCWSCPHFAWHCDFAYS